MTADDLVALRVTLQLAAVTTLVLLSIGVPLAWWLARSRSRVAWMVSAAAALPLVLPPTVLGFYLLVLMGPHGAIGSVLDALGAPPLVFSFGGLVVASVLSSLPFMVQPLRDAFASIPERLLEAASTLRAAPLDRFASVVLPLAKRGVLSACTLTFAHTVGEFGVVLMVGGNIPGSTRVLSIAIYDHAESLQYGAAHMLSALLLGVAFAALLAINAGQRRERLV